MTPQTTRVQVTINGEAVFDTDCASHDVVFVIRNGRISMIAGPGAFGFTWMQKALAEEVHTP